MGAPMNPDVEARAIAELQSLSNEAKGWLQHHINNSLTPILLEAERAGLTLLVKTALHLKGDLDIATGRDRRAERKIIEETRDDHNPI